MRREKAGIGDYPSPVAQMEEMPMSSPSAKWLRTAIIRSLCKQGYSISHGMIRMMEDASKNDYRALNEMAIRKKLEKSGPGVQQHEGDLLAKYIANGWDVGPREINPRSFWFDRSLEHELSSAMRVSIRVSLFPPATAEGCDSSCLMKDNGRLIGLFGLGDPVYAMHARDRWIGWDKDARADRLYHVMDAYVLGAAPYSFLLGGKLVAMMVCSNEVRDAFRRKYQGHESLIRQETRPPYLALVTTTVRSADLRSTIGFA